MKLLHIYVSASCKCKDMHEQDEKFEGAYYVFVANELDESMAAFYAKQAFYDAFRIGYTDNLQIAVCDPVAGVVLPECANDGNFIAAKKHLYRFGGKMPLAQPLPEMPEAQPDDFEDRLATACMACDVPDSTYESLCIALNGQLSVHPT